MAASVGGPDEGLPQISPRMAMTNSMQYKSFVAWINHHLRGKNTKVQRLDDDLEDGLVLIDLLETLSGEKLATPVKRPTLRVQKINNLAIAFNFLRRDLHMENIAPEDIADKNLKIIMGMVWSLILRYQIASLDLSIKDKGVVDDEHKQTLLEYLDRHLRPEGIAVSTFEHSFRDGMAFCGLFKRLRPELVDLAALQKEPPVVRLRTAFQLWNTHCGLPTFLDPEDLIGGVRVDERAVMTYVAMCLGVLEKHHIACAPAEGRRVAQSGKIKFVYSSSALMPKKAVDPLQELRTTANALEFSIKRMHSQRDLDAAARANPLLSPRGSSSGHGNLSPRPLLSPRQPFSFNRPADDSRLPNSDKRLRLPPLESHNSLTSLRDDPRMPSTARPRLQTTEKSVIGPEDAHHVQREVESQIRRLTTAAPEGPTAVAPATIPPSPAPASAAPAPAPEAINPKPAVLSSTVSEEAAEVTLVISAKRPLAASAPSEAPSPPAVVAPPPASTASVAPPASPVVTAAPAAAAVENIKVSRRDSPTPEARAAAVTAASASQQATGEASTTTLTLPSRPAEQLRAPSPDLDAPPLPSKQAKALQTAPVAVSGATVGPAAPTPAATQVKPASSSSSAPAKAAPQPGTEFAKVLTSVSTAITAASRTFVVDIRGKSKAEEMRQISSLRPLIVTVVREIGQLLLVMSDTREARELIAVVKSFIIAGYQFTANVAREAEPDAFKESLTDIITHVKLLLRNLAWLAEPH